MTLAPDQAALVAAGLLLLAFDEPGTISAMDHDVAHGAEHGIEGVGHAAVHEVHGKIIQLHVKTPAGEVFYHLPIGSLIIKHPGKVHGEHSRVIKAGEHAFAVPKDAKVMVPKDTDLTDEKVLNNAAKHVVLKSSEGEERHVHISPHSGALTDAGKQSGFEQQETNDQLHEHWKELPHGKKPVAFGGKIGAWVPHEWQIHHAAGAPESGVSAKWGKDAEGKWHLIHKDGIITHDSEHTVQGDKYAKAGKLVPEHEVPEPKPAHVEPEPAQPSAGAAAKINIGGVPVSKDEIHDAISILSKDKSTAVKQPLAKAGHPLAAMDYHGVSKEVLKAHPELKVAKGSKQAHVGQVKLTILHHLAEQAGEFPQAQAEEHVAEDVKEQVQEQAHHAADLTPATHELGGVAASKEEIAAAISALESTKSTQINQTLKAKGNPLGKSDYWSVVKGHQAKFPNATKGMKAKPVFVMALKHHLEQLSKEDSESGHEVDAKVHELVDKGVPASLMNPYMSSLQSAFKQASETGLPHYLYKPESGGGWHVSLAKPAEDSKIGTFFRVGPDHSVKYFPAPGAAGETWPADKVAQHVKAMFSEPKPVVQSQTKKLLESTPKAPEIKAKLPPDPEKLVKDFKESPEWPELHELVQNSKPLSYDGPVTVGNVSKQIAIALQQADKDGKPWYVKPNWDGYVPVAFMPDAGSYAAPGALFAEVTPDHQVALSQADGMPHHWDAAQVLSAAKQHLEAAEPEPEPETAKEPEPEHTVPLILKGAEVGKIPAGSAVYHTSTSAPDTSSVKWVKTPDGHWEQWGVASGKTQSPFSDDDLNDKAASGLLTLEGTPPGEGLQAKSIEDQPAQSLEQWEKDLLGVKEPETPPPGEKTVQVNGLQSAPVPAGSKVYYGATATGSGIKPQTAQTAGTKWVKLPDGTWTKFTFSSYGNSVTENSVPGYQVADLESKVKSGSLLEEGAEPAGHAEAVEKSLQLQGDLKQGAAVEGAANYGVVDDFDKALAGAVWRAVSQGNKEAYLDKSDSGWKILLGYHNPSIEHYHFSFENGLPQLTHTVDGKTDKLDSQQIYDAVGKHVVTGAVLIDGKAYKSGFYYNPKSTKSYLEIQAGQGGKYFKGYANHGDSSKAHYIWHKTDGSTETISPAAATKKLETNTEHQAQPKQGLDASTAVKAVKAKYASVAQPGQYKTWSSGENAPSSQHVLELKPDGSGVVSPGVVLDEHGTSDFIKGGALLDQHGNTVVQPGTEPATFHVFGAPGVSRDELQGLLDTLSTSGHSDFFPAFLKAYPGVQQKGSPLRDNAISFFNEKLDGKSTGTAQQSAILGLLREMLQIPKNKATGLDGKPAEVSYLKGLPPGISKPEDAFTWAGNGMAKLVGPHITDYYGGSYIAPLSSLTSPELAEKIKEVSEHHGGGKVVGTHVASLSKDQRIAWLQAWRKGDMPAVFHLDASGGKVSPMHPGAPANVFTHKITWSPWNPSELPAGTPVPGEWSDHLKVTLPKAEVGNYVIKAGLQHPEYLTQAELRQWVSSHREGNQDVTDHLSSQADSRFKNGLAKYTETPVWTNDLKAANSYDIHVEEKSPANYWPSQAVEDYVKDHWSQLKPFADAGDGSPQVSHYTVQYMGAPLIQKYLDHEQAKWVAEQSKPVYSTTPGAAKPTSSHPIYEVTATVPLTGEKTQWFFKSSPPVQPGQSLKYRPDVAHAAAVLARAWGFKTPESRLVEHDGKYGTVQRKVSSPGDLAGGIQLGLKEAPKIDWGSYTEQQVGAVAREHLLDWALDNPDGRAANMLHTTDGDIVGIDKEHAWRNFGKWKGLTSDEGSDTFSKLVATQLYNAVRSHQVSKDLSDKAYVSVIRQARRMQAMPDTRMQQVLGSAFAERTNFGAFGDGDAGRAKYIAAIIDRKNGLEKDFQGVWGKVYKDAGWTLPEVPQNKLSHGFHSGFSEPTFFDHVMASKSFGVPAFFAGPHLEDGNFLTWTELAGENRYIRGEGTLRGGALKAAADWAQQHQDGGLVNPLPSVPTGPVTVQPKVNDEMSWHNAVVAAAKAVSKHAGDQVYTGSWTSAKLQELNAAKTKMQIALDWADKAKQQGPDSEAENYVKAMFGGHPEHVGGAAKHYLGQVKQIEDAQQAAGQFHKGDLPRWEGKAFTIAAPPAEEPKPEVTGVKVELRPSTRILSAAHETTTKPDASKPVLDPETNELHLGNAVYSYPGNSWHITLPTGEIIELNDESKTDTKLAQQGRVRFRAVASDGSASLERIRNHLISMGVPMDEAEQHDMELFYWRHLAGVLADRTDRNTGKHGDVWQSLRQDMTSRKLPWSSSMPGNVSTLADAKLDPQEELGIWRSAWSHLTTPGQVQDWSDAKGYMPHLGHYDIHQPEVPNGKPFWYRFDATPEKLSGKEMPGHSFYDTQNDATKITSTGGLLSTEARLRALGLWAAGKSSTTDMGHGSSGVVYTRLNQESGYHTHNVLLHPRVLARTSTYGFNTDNYGKINLRSSQSFFDFDKAAAHTASNNETDIKDGTSLLGDVMLVRAYDEEQRQQIIDNLKAHGITHLNGLPVEQRVVTDVTPSVIQNARSGFMSDKDWFSHPAEPYVAPAAGAVSKEHSATETAEEASQAGSMPEEHAEVLGTHELAASDEKVNQLFYHQPTQPHASLGSPEVAQLKAATAARLADKMTSSTEALSALAKDAHLTVPASWGPERQATTGALVGVWAHTNSSPLALAYQQVAHDMFGIPKPQELKVGSADQEAVDKLVADHGPVLKDFLKSQYDLTQQDLKEAGITHLTLHRGFAWGQGSGPWGKPLLGTEKPDWASAPVGSQVDTPVTKPLSSFAAHFDTNSPAYSEFMGSNHTIVKTTVPASLVLSYPRSGIGSYWQSEFTVLDSPGKWEIWKQG